jgi:hypothetical protein
VSLTSPEDGNRSDFRNVAFSGYLNLVTMERVRYRKPCDGNGVINEMKGAKEELFLIEVSTSVRKTPSCYSTREARR